MKNLYFLERRHFINPKPLISRTPHLNPRRNPMFSVPTRSPRRVDEFSFLAQQIPIDGTPWIEERSFYLFLFFFFSFLSLSLTLPFAKSGKMGEIPSQRRYFLLLYFGNVAHIAPRVPSYLGPFLPRNNLFCPGSSSNYLIRTFFKLLPNL